MYFRLGKCTLFQIASARPRIDPIVVLLLVALRVVVVAFALLLVVRLSIGLRFVRAKPASLASLTLTPSLSGRAEEMAVRGSDCAS